MTLRISPEGRRSSAMSPSLDMSWIAVPALRPILAPPPGRNSTLWTTVPVGMLRSGRALPGRMSAPEPDSSMSPTWTLSGAMMYRFSPST